MSQVKYTNFDSNKVLCSLDFIRDRGHSSDTVLMKVKNDLASAVGYYSICFNVLR